MSGHKLGAPTGTGVLLVRRGLRLDPLLAGGDQERARRAGMEDLAALVGLGAAAAELAEELDPAGAAGPVELAGPQEDDPMRRLDVEAHASRQRTDRVLAAVAGLDGVEVHGDPVDRLPHLVCLGIEGIEPQAVLLGLDQAGIAVHSGSACASEGLEDSPVLAAMGVDAHRSLRISVGWSSTDDDVDALLGALPDVLARLRALGHRA